MDVFKTLILDTPDSLDNISGVLPVVNGGTGADNAPDARVNLLPDYTGNANKVLSLNGTATDVEWTSNGAGDVAGPASSTDNAVARFDSTTGKVIQNSGVTISDANLLTADALSINNNTTLGSSNSDTVTCNARIASEFTPATDNTYDLGRTGHEWRDLYLDGTANIDSLVADTADINGGTIDGTTVGATTPSTGAFTTLSATGALTAQTYAVIGEGANSGYVRFRNTTSTSGFDFGLLAGAGSADAYVFNRQASSNLILGTSNTEAMRITSSGDVGVGTATPAAKLDVSVAGGMARVGSGSGNNLFQAYSGSVGAGIWAGGQTRLYSTGDMTLSVGATLTTSAPTGYTDALTISSTGLAVTGSLSSTGKITSGGNIQVVAAGDLTWGGDYGAGIPVINGTSGVGFTFYPGGSTTGAVGVLNASGLAVTGALSATGVLTITKATGGQTVANTSGNTAGTYQSFGTSAGTKGYIGLGDQLVSGGSVNDVGIDGFAGNIIFATASATRATISSTGLAVTGALSATTALQAKTGTTNPASSGALTGLSMGFDSYTEVSWIQSERNSLAETRSLLLNPNGGFVGIGTTGPSYQLELSTDSAAKPSTNTWTIASDARIKTETGEYTKGLDAVLSLRPVTYRYNGKAGMVDDGEDKISIIAQEAVNAFPECVGSYMTKLDEDDEEETEVLNWNGHALTFALVNSIKELAARLEALENN